MNTRSPLLWYKPDTPETTKLQWLGVKFLDPLPLPAMRQVADCEKPTCPICWLLTDFKYERLQRQQWEDDGGRSW